MSAGGGVPFSDTYIERVLDPSYRNWRGHFLAASLTVHRAHLCMLSERGIVPAATASALKRGIDALGDFDPPAHLPGWRDREAGALRVEDLYFLYERALGDTVGQADAAWLHTARSRNDMDGTIFRMVLRERLSGLLQHTMDAAAALHAREEAGATELTVLFTHGQPANPSTVAHYLSAMELEILEDARRLEAAIATVDQSLMGACAITGTGFDVDRARMAELLGFGGFVPNTYQAISSSHWLVEPAQALGALMGDLGRFAADLLHKASCEVGLFRFPDDLVQVSSIMPQKRNPVIIEHLRIQAGLAAQACAGVETCFRNVPYQDVNENADAPVCAFMEAIEGAHSALDLFTETVAKIESCDARALEICAEFGVTTTELADCLVREKGIGFREAHGIAAAFASAERKGGTADYGVIRSRFRALSGRELGWSDAELADILSPWRFVRARATAGGPAGAGMAVCRDSADAMRDPILASLEALRARLEAAGIARAEAWARLP